ncbi:MAG TPA: NADH-quinone oxidoreductase subunit G [Streptosporangiaceae bacterium]|jgi:NADH-quinone oxidoreductase subunit G|nr:NADH-quinone oxidoreductase subunit G [Streptosporangiaceae bacterium]
MTEQTPSSAPDPQPPVTAPQHTGPEANPPAPAAAAPATAEIAGPADGVKVSIDGFEIRVPKGTLIIRAAEQLGIEIPRFCDHPLLDPIGACRQCLVQVEGQPKPPASCTTTVTDGMVVRTQLTSAVAEKAQRGMMELLLVNHPLDCPMCDKGGECPLQNQAMSTGQGETRFDGTKRTFPKPIALSSQVLLDRERCIQCARCTRFADQIPGDPLIELLDRGPQEQVGVAEGVPFDSYFSGNTVQICPVGALTGASYRFRARPFDLVSTPSVCEHCAAGCRQRTDHRRGAVTRRLAGNDPEVNEEWNCDKGRWAFTYATQPDRLVSPLVRDSAGVLQPASWPEALSAAARGLLAARGRAGVLPGGRLTLEDSYAYAKFARVALATNDIDMRARPHSAEELQFLADHVVGRIDVTYSDLQHAPAVLLAGFEPEDECPIVFLRLRKAVRTRGLPVYSLAALASRGLAKLSGTLLPTVPGGEAAALTALAAADADSAAARALRQPGAVILAGERLAEVPGALSGAAWLASQTGARLAWIPRRAGERGAIEAGALPNLLPGGRRIGTAAVSAEVARVWGVGSLPGDPGFGTSEILAATAAGDIEALLIGAVDPADLPDPAAAVAAIEAAEFVVSLEQRVSAVTDRADVVFPVAVVAEKAGTFVNWEGRPGSFTAALSVPVRTDLDVLAALADEMDVHLGLPDIASVQREITVLTQSPALSPSPTPAAGPQAPAGQVSQLGLAHPGPGTALLATWHNLLDAGRLQDGEPNLAGTARPAVALLSASTAAEAGTGDGGKITVATGHGEITVPVEIADMPDRVVWLPANSAGSAVRRELRAGHGSVVSVRSAR